MKLLNNVVPRTCMFALLGLVAGMSGCGGGGGGSSGDNGSGTPVAISESNMNDVASTAILAGNASGTASLGGNLVTGVSSAQGVPAPTRQLVELTLARTRQLANLSATQPPATSVQETRTEQCPLGGSISVNYNVQQTGSPSPGDQLRVSFSNCQIDTDFLVSGGMTIAINSFSGNFMPVGAMNVSVVLSSLHLNFAGATFDANGDMTIDTTASSTSSHTTMHSNSYSYAVAYSGRSASVTLTNYNLDATENRTLNTVTWTESFHFAASFPSFSGSGDVTTLTPLVKQGTNGIVAGKLKVVGDNSTLYMTFLPGNLVLLELDRGNDGTIDATATRSVFDLNPFTELF